MNARVASSKTAGPAPRKPQRFGHRSAQPLFITRVTNTGKELKIGREPEDPNKPQFMNVSQMQTLDGRPLERAVSLVFEDAIFIREGETGYDNEVHREFWFNPPKEGWKQEPKTLEILKPMTETEIGQAWPQTAEIAGEGRMPLSSLEVHKVVVGEIEEIHLFHGIFVDIGAEKLGWIAMGEEAWLKMGREDPDLHMRLMPGNKLKCRIAVVADPVMYRFPIVLEALDDAVAAYAEDVTKLNTSTMPVILQSHHDLEDLSKELGRTFRPDYQMPEPVLPGYVKDMLVIDDDTNMEDEEGPVETRDLMEDARKQFGLRKFQMDEIMRVLEEVDAENKRKPL